ncbi:E3 ubiquitin-protein ligase RNF31 [Aulostomus maculatus]
MMINPSCPYVDAVGNITLDELSNWTQGVSDLSGLVSEMRRAFQKDTPLYARSVAQAPPPVGSQSAGSLQRPITAARSKSPSVPSSRREQSRQVRAGRSYTEELLGIDFSAFPPTSDSHNPFLSSAPSGHRNPGAPLSDSLSRMMGTLRLHGETSRDQQSSGAAPGLPQGLSCQQHQSEAAAGVDQMAAHLPADKASMFLMLLTMDGRSFSPADVLEAVQLNRDFPSALKFLTHSCPICQEQVSFSKIITMTHCSCFLCQTCFKAFFTSAIKEKSVDQLVCPQCGLPEVKGQGQMEEFMEYFNLLDTQIRHFLPPQIHELFQRKLRDRALQEMPNFRWCAHCSFGVLHEADRLRMDCPSCQKSTCSRCRSPWSPHHQGRSCQQFRVWQQQNQPDHSRTLLSCNSIECPKCQLVFSLSKGGCLHFTCSQCQHQFCGGCSQAFSLGSACGFSVDCGTKGLHAHHPRDCLYHLRDWSVPRLHLLLQYYRASPSWLEPTKGSSADTSQTDVCLVLELRDDGSKREEPCGRPSVAECRGFCQSHYKERLVELINCCRADPAVLFSAAEMLAELQRWNVAAPARKPEEPELLYAHRLRMTLTNSVPLRVHRRPPLKLQGAHCPLTSIVPAAALPPHLLLHD